MYYHGNGVNQDYNEAKKWLDKAENNKDAQRLLGHMYFNGNGVPQDYEKANGIQSHTK